MTTAPLSPQERAVATTWSDVQRRKAHVERLRAKARGVAILCLALLGTASPAIFVRLSVEGPAVGWAFAGLTVLLIVVLLRVLAGRRR